MYLYSLQAGKSFISRIRTESRITEKNVYIQKSRPFRAGLFFIFASVLYLVSSGCAPAVRVTEFDRRHREAAENIHSGDFYRTNGVYNRALEYYRDALRIRACTVNVYYRLAQTAAGLDNAETALYYLRYSMKYYPSDINSYVLTGKILRSENDIRLSERYFARALQLAPASMRAQLAGKLKRLRDSASYEFSGDDVELISKSIAAAARNTTAESAFNKSLEAPADIRKKALLRAVEFLLGQGETGKAEKLLQLTWKDSKDNSLLIRGGNILLKEGKSVRAAFYYRTYIDNDPDPGIGYFNMGVMYLRNGLQDRADEMFAAAGDRFADRAEHLKKELAQDGEINPLEAPEVISNQ